MSSRLVLSIVVGRVLLGAFPSDAACPNPFPQASATQVLSAIRIVPGGDNFSVAAGTSTALNEALAQWNAACGSDVPTLSKTESSPVTFAVNYMKGVYSLDTKMVACAGTPEPAPGTVLGGGVITIFEETRNGTDCRGLYTEMTMHEIGHRLGLAHSSCNDNIMTGVLSTDMLGLTPEPVDCKAVDDFWLTPEEYTSSPPPICECSFASDCESLYGAPEFGTWSCVACQCLLLNSPLVLYLPDYFSTSDGTQSWWKGGFCGPEAPTVCLDWLGDGNITCTAWAEPGSEVAFVVALSDDDASRLAAGVSVRAEPWRHFFGNVTIGPEGDFPYVHGFAALATRCGQDPEATSAIDLTECGLFLHVWEDRSGDGNIDVDELLEFQDLRIESLGDVRKTGKKDRCGNTFQAESHASCSGHSGNGKCGTWLDVFFEPR